ncbi:MAG TPA: TadG family pilus assembly protein [Rhizomicrobium sp.]|jgi:uncharacterized membrane protein|nr:TadG family pilus assembly protein [Rhizomicrobium sp.]
MRASRWRFLRNRDGSVSIVVGVCLLMFVGFAAAAVDFGYVYLKGRQLQGIADMSAMAAAANLSDAEKAAQETANSNGWTKPVSAEVTTGLYQPDASIPPSQRYAAGIEPANAARVTLKADADLFFASVLIGKKAISLSRTATAAQGQLASFSIGTRLASLKGGVANALLSGLTGSSINLSVMDYNALANAQVDLFQYVDALRTRMDLEGASFDRTLSGQIETNGAIGAIMDALNSAGNSAAGQAIQQIAQSANSTPIELGQLLDLGPYGGQDYVNASGPSGLSVNALDLAQAVLALSQGGRQVQLKLNSVLPGVAGVTAWLAIGERPERTPWLTVTDNDSAIVRTAQARLYVDTKVAPLGGLAGVAAIDLPIYVELASAKAKLASLNCASPTVSLAVSPSIGKTAIGSVNVSELDNFTEELTVSPATLINVLLIKATGKSEIDLGGADWQTVEFDSADIADHAVKTVSTEDALTTATASLLSNMSLNVQVGGLGIGSQQVAQSISRSLQPVAAPLDTVLDSLEAMLGVGLGQADVWVDGVRCQHVALVQ